MKITNLPTIKNKAFLSLFDQTVASLKSTEKRLRELEKQNADTRAATIKAADVLATFEERLAESRRLFAENIRREITALATGQRPKAGDIIKGIAASHDNTVLFGPEYEALATVAAGLILDTAKPIAAEVCKQGRYTYAERDSLLAEIESETVALTEQRTEDADVIAKICEVPRWAPIFEG